MNHLGRSAGIVGVLTALLAGTANAKPLVFFGIQETPVAKVYGAPLTERTAFESNLVDLRRVNFEDITPGETPISLNFEGASLNPISAALSTETVCTRCLVGETETNTEGETVFGRYNTTGATDTTPKNGQWWEADGNFELTFSEAITAFGFYGTDIGDLGGQLQIELFRKSGDDKPADSISVATTVDNPAGSLLFWGFYEATGYKAIRFSIKQLDDADPEEFDVFGFDDMVIGRRATTPPPDGVPEPATLALVGLSLGALAVTRRRKSTAPA